MYPLLVRLGSIDVTGFGLLVGVGTLPGLHNVTSGSAVTGESLD